MKKLYITICVAVIGVSLFPSSAFALRRWTAGAELNTNANGYECNAIVNAYSIDSVTKRSGKYSWHYSANPNDTSCGIPFGAANLTDVYARAYVNFTTFPAVEMRLAKMQSLSGVTQIYVTIDSSGVLRLYDQNGQITGTKTLSTGTWYRLEINLDARAASGSQTISAQVDGVSFASSSSRTIPAGVMQYNIGPNQASEGDSTYNFYVDDVAINDVVGSVQNSFPGAGSVAVFHANAAGDASTCTRRGTDSGACWSQIDEESPDNATKYFDMLTANDTVDVNLEAYASTTSGTASTDTITLVEVDSRHTGAAAQARAHNLRIKSQASGTVQNGWSTSCGTSSWGTNGWDLANCTSANGLASTTLVSYTDPQAGGAWTPTLFNNAQVGVICTDATPDCSITSIWTTVEYNPQSAPVITDTTPRNGRMTLFGRMFVLAGRLFIR